MRKNAIPIYQYQPWIAAFADPFLSGTGMDGGDPLVILPNI